MERPFRPHFWPDSLLLFGPFILNFPAPNLPLKIWEETPILFGEPTVEIIGETKILHADLVASTYF